MDHGHVQRNSLSGKGLPVGSSQANHLSEKYVPDRNDGPSSDYLEVWLDRFPHHICDSVLEKFIQLLDSDWNLKKEPPRWWPSGLRYMAVQELRKQEKTKLARVLLCGELMNIATVQELKGALEDATAQYDSIQRSLIISQILKAFETEKFQHQQNDDGPLGNSHRVNEIPQASPPGLCTSDDSRGFLQPLSIPPPALRVLALNSPYPGFVIDLNHQICIEWRSYSCRGDPLTPATLTWAVFWGGNLIPLDSLLPPLLRNSQIAQSIQATGKLGVLSLIIVDEQFFGHSRLERSYMAFSIRIAVSRPGMPHLDVPAHGWEFVSSAIKQLEASCSVPGAPLAAESMIW